MTEYLSDEDIKERIEHRDILLDLRSLMTTNSGRNLLRYLFKHFQVGNLPEMGLEGTLLADRLGFLRAGISIFDLASEANPEIAGTILAEIKKENYERLSRTS
jgi:hypothetical protein